MIGLLEVRRRKRTFVLIGVIIALVAYLIIMLNGVALGFNDAFGSAVRNLDADGVAYAEESQRNLFQSEMPQRTVDAIAEAPGVEDAAPMGYMNLEYRDRDGSVLNFSAFGYDPGSIAEPEVIGGRALAPGDTRAVLADQRFLDREDLEVGDTITVIHQLQEIEFTIAGEIDEGYLEFVPVVYLLRETWQELSYGAIETPAAASIVLVRGTGVAGVTGRGFEIVSKDVAFSSIGGVEVMGMMLLALRIGGYAIGAAVVGVFFYILTLQKIPNIGLLKALGASSGYVVRQTMAQSLVVALLASAIAIPLAMGTSAALAQVPDMIPVTLTAGTYATTAIALVVMTFLGVAFSIRSLVKVDPIIALAQQQ